MALDTATKRLAALDFGDTRQPGMAAPTGAVGDTDRYQFLWLFLGAAAVGNVAGSMQGSEISNTLLGATVDNTMTGAQAASTAAGTDIAVGNMRGTEVGGSVGGSTT